MPGSSHFHFDSNRLQFPRHHNQQQILAVLRRRIKWVFLDWYGILILLLYVLSFLVWLVCLIMLEVHGFHRRRTSIHWKLIFVCIMKNGPTVKKIPCPCSWKSRLILFWLCVDDVLGVKIKSTLFLSSCPRLALLPYAAEVTIQPQLYLNRYGKLFLKWLQHMVFCGTIWFQKGISLHKLTQNSLI